MSLHDIDKQTGLNSVLMTFMGMNVYFENYPLAKAIRDIYLGMKTATLI
jgi:hypothetical protein